MNEATMLTDLVVQSYDIQAASLISLFSSTSKRIYSVEQPGREHWVLRAYHQADSNTANPHDLATLLLFLERHGYPAERVVRDLHNESLVIHDGWQLLMTTFIDGSEADNAPATLQQFGALLGRLHALKTVTSPALPVAEMLPAPELAYALSQLTEVAQQVPQDLMPRYQMLVEAIHSIDHCEGLPTVIIHNDCHLVNVVRTHTGQMLLIDWEGAGLGAAVIDVGFLLVSSQPFSLAIGESRLDAERINAVIDGYCQHHILTPVELDRLPDSILFRSLVYGACSFARAIAEQRPEYPSETCWWWTRYTAAEGIAKLARKRFELYL